MFSEKQEAASSRGHQAPLLLHICSSDCKAAGKARQCRCAARSEILPGSHGQVPVSVSLLTAVPAVMNETLWVIHGPRSWDGVGKMGRLRLQTPPRIM